MVKTNNKKKFNGQLMFPRLEKANTSHSLKLSRLYDYINLNYDKIDNNRKPPLRKFIRFFIIINETNRRNKIISLSAPITSEIL